MSKFIMAFVVIILMALTGYVYNIVQLTRCDFKPSYKCEIIRGVGILLFPMGAILGVIPNKKFGE